VSDVTARQVRSEVHLKPFGTVYLATLAYHYTRTTEADKAVTYLERFAAQATRAYAHEVAATTLQDALRHVEQLPAAARHHHRRQVVLQLAQSFSSLGRFGESLELLLRHRQIPTSRAMPPSPRAGSKSHVATGRPG
jgi:hypothetical protein